MSYLSERAAILQKLQTVNLRECFDLVTIDLFRFQAKYNPVYKAFLQHLHLDWRQIKTIRSIPFLPIDLFKTSEIKTGHWSAQTIFKSSGTSGQEQSKHFVFSLEVYLSNTVACFEDCFGHPKNFAFLALLPSYIERADSSLVHMARHFISLSDFQESGFYIDDFQALKKTIADLQRRKIPTILLGVSFALADFAEQYPGSLKGIYVMETGGMKGRRKEITRHELHEKLKTAFETDNIHSEYGMTELFSQAYSKGGGIYKCPPTLRVICREISDPLAILPPGKRGALNFIDLANLDTCSFIATDDIGLVNLDGTFEVIGRLDNSEMRGCNLMVE